MRRTPSLTTAFAIWAGLAAAGVASAQGQTGSATPAAVTAPPAPSAARSAPPWAQSGALTIKPWDPETSNRWDPNASQPTYSVNPPPIGESGVYLPAAVLGYTKSAVGCVVIGCEDGPQVGGARPSSSGPVEAAPPINPEPSDRR